MTLPRPELGLVIRYSYLWLSEHREGREPPAAFQAAATPGLPEQDQRRNARQEKKDVIEIEHGVNGKKL